MGRAGAGWAVLGWLGGLGAASWGLIRLGDTEWLRIDWSDPLAWLAGVEPEVALAAIARLVGLVLVGWIALSTLVYLLARLGGLRSSSIDWLSIGPLRRAVDALLAGSLVVTTMAPAGAVVDPIGGTVATTAPAASVDPSYVPIPAGPGIAEPGPEETTEEPEEEPVEVLDETRVTVTPGDHLWNLAEARLAQWLGRSPSEAEIAPYWVRVVEANRNRVRSGDPELIFPGEEVVLPAVDSDD